LTENYLGGGVEPRSEEPRGRRILMDLSVSIAIGSSIQIALYVAPVLVLASYFIAPSPSIWYLAGVFWGPYS